MTPTEPTPDSTTLVVDEVHDLRHELTPEARDLPRRTDKKTRRHADLRHALHEHTNAVNKTFHPKKQTPR